MFTKSKNKGDTIVSDKNVVTKKTPAKKAPANSRLSVEEEEYLTIKIVAIFWERFGTAAEGMKIDPDCFDRAVSLGALANMRKKLVKLSQFGADFQAAERCSIRAGQRASQEAKRLKSKTITADIYEEAFLWVAQSVSKLAQRKQRQGELVVEAVWCP
jgi:hypothetical protein